MQAVLKVHIDADLGAPAHKRKALIPVLEEWSMVACLHRYLASAGYIGRPVAGLALSTDDWHLDDQLPIGMLRDGQLLRVSSEEAAEVTQGIRPRRARPRRAL